MGDRLGTPGALAIFYSLESDYANLCKSVSKKFEKLRLAEYFPGNKFSKCPIIETELTNKRLLIGTTRNNHNKVIQD